MTYKFSSDISKGYAYVVPVKFNDGSESNRNYQKTELKQLLLL